MQYKVSLTTKLKPPQSGIIVIEPEDYTGKEVRALQSSGAFVLAYLSIGSTSDERSYYKRLKPYLLGKLEDWEHERYLDLRAPEARAWCREQAEALKRKGFDGWWLDNVDVYEEYRTTEMFLAVTATIQAIKAVGGYVMINGGMAYLTDLMIPYRVQSGVFDSERDAKKAAAQQKTKGFNCTVIEMDGLYAVQAGAFPERTGADQTADRLEEAGFSAARVTMFEGEPASFIDGVTQEEVFSRIENYRGKGKFGKQQKKDSEQYQAHMRRLIGKGIGGFLLEYTTDPVLRRRIEEFCVSTGAASCVADDVNL
ncbi:MAG: endo alpha-1,4 polygalactosaminidase [Eubacteriales bacterium]|nr:endo alpha-1,4 polygalactosaminidase [Eubacteriales bacterium]